MKYIFISLIYAVSLSSLSHSAVKPDINLAHQVEHYYETTKHCSSSQVENITSHAKHSRVTLAIEPDWQSTLAAATPNTKSSWFGIHCPYLFLPPWNQNAAHYDVIIHADFVGRESYQLSCRAHQRSQL